MEAIIKRIEWLNRLVLFVLFICLMHVCALGYILLESDKTLERANLAVQRLEALDASLDSIEHKIDTNQSKRN